MKKINGKFWRHLSTVCLLMFFAILAVGSSSTKKGIKAYKKGDYDTALKELKGTTTDGSADFVDEFYYLGKVYSSLGQDSNAKKAFTKAYNLMANEPSKKSEFQKKYPSEYEELLGWGEEQIKIQKATANVGTWTLYQVDERYDKKKVSDSFYFSSIHKPKEHITLTEDGKILPSLVGNQTFFYWSYSEEAGFQVLDSNGEIKGGINPQGYLQINTLTINSKGQPHHISVYYTKD